MQDVKIQVHEANFDVGEEYRRLADDPSFGAVVTFTGLVRELQAARLEAMTLEHYPAMTEHALAAIVKDAKVRWPLGRVTVIHRVGRLTLNEQIVFVGVASAHRNAAFAAAEFIMDFLKTRAPFWKKEHTDQGDYWVAAKTSDAQAAHRWQDSDHDEKQD